jgi:eukaryotic-like serine/threonine-protein kinase
MSLCELCREPLPESARFCPGCGVEVGIEESPTLGRAPDPPPSPRRSARPAPDSDAASHGRFLPGRLLGDRYRIVAQLGRGGMGEVYRADDLTLAQPVALKFLPKELANDPERLERLRKEVRSARQVSHPNVCRVFDIGELDGERFLSMEYVEGEDLAHLIRRIGALPEAKALQVSRQIAAGLAAAHDKGLIHRDLKPANVMLDERGVARVTDFGLAGTVEELSRGNAREGTPHYMAPEQLAGEEVSVRSDLYSLGLVMVELFTGKRAFVAETIEKLVDLRRSATSTAMSELTRGLDPAIQRVIARCLEENPAKRPASALAVSAALPGGDPLAAALAAGETPSPEMVAAAGDEGLMRPAHAAIALAIVVVGSVLTTAVWQQTGGVLVPDVPHSPDVMRTKAREMLGRLGYGALPRHEIGKYEFSPGLLDYVKETDKRQDRWKRLGRPGPPLYLFWYRNATAPLVSANYFSGLTGSNLTPTNPPMVEPGMIRLVMDPQGRLTDLYVVPPAYDPAPPTTAYDWTPLLREAGRDPASLRSATPEWTPPFAHARAAWTGTYEGADAIPFRVEAASYVFFTTIPVWVKPPTTAREAAGDGAAVRVIALLLALSVLFGSSLLARRNIVRRRGDLLGANRLAAFVLFMLLVTWALKADHVAGFGEFRLLIAGLSWSLFCGSLVWVLYMALEPWIRRRWPQALITWTRLLQGRLRDPLVGRDILVGITVAVLLSAVGPLPRLYAEWAGAAVPPPAQPPVYALLHATRRLLAEIVFDPARAIVFPFLYTFIIMLFRLLLRRDWAALAAFVIFLATMVTLGEGPVNFVAYLLTFGVLALVLSRLGLVSVIGFAIANSQLDRASFAPMKLGAWDGWPLVIMMVVLWGLALWAFRTALAGRKILGEDLG